MDENTKKQIIEFNKQFGIETKFITSESVLGYALGNTIYINEAIDQDYERTNRHELLHFFEETDEFETIKRRLLEENRDKLEEIREEYELRYYGIYSEEEIKEGILDNEIVIDMMVDNSSIEYGKGLKVGDEFLGQVRNGLEEKRYLNMTIRSNIQNMNLSDWEKIFVENYYDGKERKLPQGNNKIDKIREDIERYLEELYEIEEEKMKINPNSPEVKREYESEIKALKARGEDTSYLETNKKRGYEEIAERISKQLYAEYKHIVDLSKGLDYEPAFKAMMLRETLTKTYKLDKDENNKEEKTIIKNRKLNESIAGHMILNERTLKTIYNNLKEYNRFANLYFAAVAIYKETISKESGIKLEGVETYDKGKWLKFDGKRTDEDNYIENSKRLAALVQDTPWCTKQLASSQLEDGDFYVFVDNEGDPHIAVKTLGDSIDEVRGIKNGNAQELEEEYRDVAISFLENNKEIENGREWLEKEEWNKRLIEYKQKIDSGEFTIDDVPRLINDYCKEDYRNHGDENSNKAALEESLEKIRGTIAEYYECKEEEICIGDVDYGELKLSENPYRIIFGNANFQGSQITDLEQLQRIGGNAYFRNSQIRDLGELQSIGGYANFEYSYITDLGQLQSIGGNANFEDSRITDLGPLQSIGGYANFEYSYITDLGQLQSIGGYADFYNSQITDLGRLQRIGGHANFRDSQIKDLGQLQSIGGYADFEYSYITDLGQLQRIGGDADFYNSLIKDLGQLQRIGGHANFRDSQIKDLGQLQSIGGYADFENSQIKDLGQLQRIGGDAYFSNSQIKDLGHLQRIGGNAYFRNSQVIDLGKLQRIGGDAYFSNSHIKDLGQLQRIGGDAYFRNSQVIDLGNLQSIGGGAIFEYSYITNLGQLQSIGGYADFDNSQIKDLGQLQSIGGNAYFRNSQVIDLGKLQSIGGEIYGFNDAETIISFDELLKQIQEKIKLTGQDIGKAGFGLGVEEYDNAEEYLDSIKTKPKNKEE